MARLVHNMFIQVTRLPGFGPCHPCLHVIWARENAICRRIWLQEVPARGSFGKKKHDMTHI